MKRADDEADDASAQGSITTCRGGDGKRGYCERMVAVASPWCEGGLERVLFMTMLIWDSKR